MNLRAVPRLLALLTTALVSIGLAAVPASAAVARAAAPASTFPPSCNVGTTGYNYPYPPCVPAPWTTNPSVPTLQGSKVSITHRIVHRGPRYSYVLVTVTGQFANGLAMCPGGGVPFGDLPCQYDDASLGLIGRWAGHRIDTTWSGGTDCGRVTSGTCRYTFRLYHLAFHGLFVGMVVLSVEDLTSTPLGGFATTGFGFDFSVYVPRHLR